MWQNYINVVPKYLSWFMHFKILFRIIISQDFHHFVVPGHRDYLITSFYSYNSNWSFIFIIILNIKHIKNRSCITTITYIRNRSCDFIKSIRNSFGFSEKLWYLHHKHINVLNYINVDYINTYTGIHTLARISFSL